MCEFYCNVFLEKMLSWKTLLDYSNLFSPSDYKKNEKIIYNYFKEIYQFSSLDFKKKMKQEIIF